ncbi:MAG: AAA family ATPase, partial [Methanomicrobia archaeon]|nr:AAA family ATPase [Methanomicrobia archaeon]
MFDQIYIENFKPFQELKLPLSKINLLMGANNAGKTSILEAILTMKEFFGHTSYGWHQYSDQIYHPFEDDNRIDFKRVVYAQDKDREIKLGSEVTVDGK